LEEFETIWSAYDTKIKAVSGKDALSFINQQLQDRYGINVTPTGIVDAMHSGEVPKDMRELVESLCTFAG